MSKLKYYDGTDWKIVNGQVTGDTLPVGSIIDFTGQDIPAGWVQEDKEIGKTLWEGSFTSGSINVPDLSKYYIIGIIADGVLCIGTKSFGGGIYGKYGGTDYGVVSYRLSPSGDTFSINNNDKGAFNNGSQVAITGIIGFL